jgi:hypothetical protein
MSPRPGAARLSCCQGPPSPYKRPSLLPKQGIPSGSVREGVGSWKYSPSEPRPKSSLLAGSAGAAGATRRRDRREPDGTSREDTSVGPSPHRARLGPRGRRASVRGSRVSLGFIHRGTPGLCIPAHLHRRNKTNRRETRFGEPENRRKRSHQNFGNNWCLCDAFQQAQKAPRQVRRITECVHPLGTSGEPLS